MTDISLIVTLNNQFTSPSETGKEWLNLGGYTDEIEHGTQLS